MENEFIEPPYIMNADNNILEFKLLNKDTFEEQCYVYAMALGGNENVPVYWETKHYRNPLGNSLIFGAFLDNKLVGIECFQPYLYECNGEVYNVFNSTDSGVLQECRGKGIWGKLVRFAEEYIKTHTNCDVMIGFPNYRNSYPGYQKMLWETVCFMNNYLLVNNAKTFLKVVIPSKKNLHPIFRVILNFQKLFIKFYPGKRKLFVKPISDDALIWNDKNDKISIKLSPECLSWKLGYKNLSCLKVSDKNNNVLATCIYGVSKYYGEDILYINKLSFASSVNVSKKTILSSLCNYLLEQYPKTAFIRVWTMPADSCLNRLYKSLIFARTRHSNPFIIKKISNKSINYQWDISFLDLD